jgi:uncharacterized protein
MKVILSGGTGYLGKLLQEHFLSKNDEVVVISRSSKSSNSSNLRFVQWDGENLGDWQKELENSDVLINLSGRTVNCRYNEKNKKEIFDSRLKSTAIIGKAIQDAQNAPKIWLNFASATIYRHAEDRPMDDETGEIGSGFSVEVCKAWEKTFFDNKTSKTRQVALRLAMVMGKNDGPLVPLIQHAKMGLGGKHASGNQYISWLSEPDFLGAIEYIIVNESINGAINVSSPNPLPDREFMRLVRTNFGLPFGLPLAKWMIEIGSFFMQTESELILKSRRVVPSKLQKLGYNYKFPTIETYFEHIKNQ